MVEIILGTGVAFYFLTRMWFGIRYKFLQLVLKKRKISKRGFVFLGIDLAILLAVVFQLSFSHLGRMDPGLLSKEVRIFGIFLFVGGAFLSNWGRVALGKNWRPAIADGEIDEQQELVTSGPFSVIRHPTYGGMMLMGFGFELSLLNWLFLAIVPLSFFLYWQAKLEETALERSFPQYGQYKINTKMFLPKIF